MDETPSITVALPASYKTNRTKAYPVLYVLDGVANGDLVKDLKRQACLCTPANAGFFCFWLA